MSFRYRNHILGISVMKNNFIYEITESVMKKLIPAGIPQYFSSYINHEVLKPSGAGQEEDLWSGYSFNDLKFCFVIYLQACTVSALVFVIEVLIFELRNLFGIFALLNSLKFLNL